MRRLLSRWLKSTRSAPRSTWVIVGVVVGVTVLKLVVAASQGMTVLGAQRFDDALFLREALFIRVGQWFGPYNNLTLAKGPFYPLWVAVVSRLSLSLPIANQLLYACACGLIALVTRESLRNKWASTGLYAVLLLNPITTADGPATRALRENIYPALTLLVIACAIGLWNRTDKPPKSWIPWAISLAAAASAFWLTREEGVWIAPLLLLPALALVAATFTRRGRVRRIASAVLPWASAVVLASAVVASFAGLNHRVYGVNVITDMSQGSFPQAYGALLRITPEPWQLDAPVPTEVRKRAYAVSPTLSSIAPRLELWLKNAPPPQKNEAGEVKGGWLMWYLRDVAAAYHLYADAETSQRFYSKVASEINAACDDGRIACGPPRTGLMPPIKGAHLRPLASTGLYAVRYLVSYTDVTARPTASSLSPREKPRLTQSSVGSLIHAPLAGIDPPAPFHSQGQWILGAILALYRWVTPLAVLAAAVATVASIFVALRNRADPSLAWRAGVLVTLAALLLARIAVVALVEVTSFRAVTSIYLAPAYGIMILWAYLGVGFLGSTVRSRLAERKLSA